MQMLSSRLGWENSAELDQRLRPQRRVRKCYVLPAPRTGFFRILRLARTQQPTGCPFHQIVVAQWLQGAYAKKRNIKTLLWT